MYMIYFSLQGYLDIQLIRTEQILCNVNVQGLFVQMIKAYKKQDISRKNSNILVKTSSFLDWNLSINAAYQFVLSVTKPALFSAKLQFIFLL